MDSLDMGVKFLELDTPDTLLPLLFIGCNRGTDGDGQQYSIV